MSILISNYILEETISLDTVKSFKHEQVKLVNKDIESTSFKFSLYKADGFIKNNT